MQSMLAQLERQRASIAHAKALRAKAAADAAAAAAAAKEAADRQAKAAKGSKMLGLRGRATASSSGSGRSAPRAAPGARSKPSGRRQMTGEERYAQAADRVQKKKKKVEAEEVRAANERRLKREQKAAAVRAGELVQPLPGFEFVKSAVKREKAVVPDSTDYSDMFPDQNIGLDAPYGNAEANAKAAKENERIIREREREARRCHELREKGKTVSSHRWVPIDPETATREATARLNDFETRHGTAPKLSRTAIAAANRSVSASVSSSKSPSVPVKKLTKKAVVEQKVRVVQDKAAALRAAILKATGGSEGSLKIEKKAPEPDAKRKSPASSRDGKLGKRQREPERDDRRRGSSAGPVAKKRRRYDDESEEEDAYRYESRRRRNDDVYSDDYDEDGDDDESDDDDFGTSFEALAAEEERSAKLAALEDKREKRRLEEAKKEKERRKKEWEKTKKRR